MAKAKCDECLKQIHNPYVLAYKGFSHADFLCNDCEQYVCSKCITKHSDHFTFALKDKSNETKLDKFCEEILKELTSEGDRTLYKFEQEQTHLWDVVDVVGGRHRDDSVRRICILRGSKKWAVTYKNDKYIKLFNINNNQMARTIHLAYKPYGITEIPSMDPSQSLIAVSFPEHIDIMNINSGPAKVTCFSSIKVNGKCRDLAYCNNKLIARCQKYLYGEEHDSIIVMEISGEVINVIDLNRLLGIYVTDVYSGTIRVHSESETIYIGHLAYPSCVISLSLGGQVLHSILTSYLFTNTELHHICVDIDQNVYVIGHDFPLYKLSSDLSKTERFIDKYSADEWFPKEFYLTAIACHADTFYFAGSDGRVIIIRHE